MSRWYDKGNLIISPRETYTVVETITSGGQGFAYIIANQKGDRLFLKQYTSVTKSSSDYEIFEKHQNELLKRLATAGLNKHVCQDIEFFWDDNGIYHKVSELAKGKSLQTMLVEGEIPDDARKTYAAVLAFTIRKIHESGIIHLDLKPDNAMVWLEKDIIEPSRTNVQIKLIDFDGAMIEGVCPPMSKGTIGYQSPEQMDPGRFGQVSMPSDIFSLGIILYQLLANVYPYREDGDEVVFQRRIKRPREYRGDLPEGISDLIWRMVSPNQKERPSAEEVHDCLRSWNASADVPIRVALIAGDRRIRFHKDMVLGRDQFRGIPGYEYVSRSQARIYKDSSQGWVITQLRETENPTKVNGVAIPEGKRIKLKKNDAIEIGKLSLKVDFEYK